MAHKLNKPAKVLRVDVTVMVPGAKWPYDDGKGDPYWSGGATPKSYQWTITMTVTSKAHGSHLTRDDFVYNGLDINVDDWIAGATTGLALRIISIISKTDTTVTCVVEDYLRYNTFRSATGTGIFTIPGPGVIFEVNEDGNPIVDPLPVAVTSSDFYANLQSRFEAFTLQDNFLIEQEAHGFSEGDAIAIDPLTQEYEKADNNSLEYLVGTVGVEGPGPNAFLLQPTTRIVEHHEPAFTGTIGSFIYADPNNPGELTTIRTARKAFLQLSDPVPSSIRGTVANPTVTLGNELIINGVTVTFTTGTGTLTDAITDINAAMSFAGIGIIATEPFAPTVASSTLALNYGLVGAFTDPPGPATATINGTLVTFNDNTDGFVAYAQNVAIESDMARVINNAAITNLVASYTTSNLILTETTGASITITDGTSDTNSITFSGSNSCSGVPSFTAATTDQFIQLDRADGGEIILQNSIGDPLGDLGLVSVENGRLPFALVVEQGIRRGDTFVVANTTERDALDVLAGDQAYVINRGGSEWGMYLYNGSSWTLISTQESARTDSDTLAQTITPASASVVSLGDVNAGTARSGSGTRVSPVSVEITTPFDGNPTISVGDDGDNYRLFTADLVDFTSIGSYMHTPTYQYTGALDVFIRIYFYSCSVTGSIAATYTNGQTISINSTIVTLSTGTSVADAVTDINTAAISGITAVNVNGALVLNGTGTGFNITLAEGSGTALGDLGFTPGVITGATTGSAKVTITYS